MDSTTGIEVPLYSGKCVSGLAGSTYVAMDRLEEPPSKSLDVVR